MFPSPLGGFGGALGAVGLPGAPWLLPFLAASPLSKQEFPAGGEGGIHLGLVGSEPPRAAPAPPQLLLFPLCLSLLPSLLNRIMRLNQPHLLSLQASRTSACPGKSSIPPLWDPRGAGVSLGCPGQGEAAGVNE